MDINYTVNFSMIVSGANEGGKRLRDQDEYDYNKKFMREFGLKTDAVGWTDVNDKDFDFLTFSRMINEANKRNIKIRVGIEVFAEDSDLINGYLIYPQCLELKEYKVGKNGEIIGVVKAYELQESVYELCNNHYAVCEDVIKILDQESQDFEVKAWLPDVGKYKSKQFYICAIKKEIKHGFGGFSGLSTEKLVRKNKEEVAGYMTLFSKKAGLAVQNYPNPISFDLVFFETPYFLDKSSFMENDIFLVDGQLGVGKAIKEELVQSRLFSEEDFFPIITTQDIKTLSEKYKLFKWSHKKTRSEYGETETQKAARKQLYDKYLNVERDAKIITEKMATSKIKMIKKKFPGDFNEKAKINNLDKENICESIIPYLLISDGFQIYNQYIIFSSSEYGEYKQEFEEELKEDELIHLPLNSKVFGKTIDGEWILLLDDGRVCVFQMGNPIYVKTWDSIHEFFFLGDN